MPVEVGEPRRQYQALATSGRSLLGFKKSNLLATAAAVLLLVGAALTVPKIFSQKPLDYAAAAPRIFSETKRNSSHADDKKENLDKVSPASEDDGGHAKKGDPMALKMDDAPAQGCCQWSGRCDNSQVFCNHNEDRCKGCGGTWKDDFEPTDFGGDPAAWCSKGHMKNWSVPMPPTYMRVANSPVMVKVLTYNLEWWRVYGKKGGEGGRQGHLIANNGPFDFIGMQECQNPWHVLTDAGIKAQYHSYQGGNNSDSEAVCAAYRKAAWEELDHGEREVAEDKKGTSYYGKRTAVWFRLKHKDSGETVLFLVHHGPLPLSSGGRCGGHSTAFNILDLIAEKAAEGDAVVLLGDFNAGSESQTVTQLGSQLTRVYSGWRFGGIDHIFTNVETNRVVDKRNLGGAGSDHDALSLTFRLGTEGENVIA